MTGRVLVTGGAGFIGSHLVDLLLASGHDVSVLDNFSTGKKSNLEEAQATGRLRVIEGSILAPDNIRAALEGCSHVFHLAVECVRRSLGHPLDSHHANATGTLNMLEAAREHDVRRFLYCSSSEVYGNGTDGLLSETAAHCRPVTVYGAAKLAGELYTDAYRQTYGLGTVIIRPFNAYGPRAPQTGVRAEVIPRFVIRALNGQTPVIFGDGTNGRDFTYVTEIARGLMLAGFAPPTDHYPINIAFGRMITIQEVAEVVLHVTGRNDLTIKTHEPRPGDVHRLHADTHRAKSVLDYSARISFEDGLRRYVDWFRGKYPDPSTLLEKEIENWKMPA